MSPLFKLPYAEPGEAVAFTDKGGIGMEGNSPSPLRSWARSGEQHLRAVPGHARRLWQNHRKVVVSVLVGVVLVALGGVAVLFDVQSDIAEIVTDKLSTKTSLADLRARAKAEPKNADAQLELGHGYFAVDRRSSALHAYSKALGLNARIADQKLANNLIGCFGKKEQGSAATLLGKYKITLAAAGLHEHTRDGHASVRSDALRVLEQMGKAERGDYVNVALQDLEVADCGMRRRAVEKLATYGDKRVIAALKAAAKKDADATAWYASSCLGDAVAKAEAKVAAR